MEEIFNKVGYLDFENKKVLVLENDTMKYYYFLIISSENKFLYPTMSEFVALNKLILHNQSLIVSINGQQESEGLKRQVVKIVPKIFHNGVLVVLTVALLITILTGCKKNADLSSQITWKPVVSTPVEDTNVSTPVEEQEVHISPVIEEQEIRLSGIEDVADYLDVKNPSWDDLLKCVEQNPNISEKYRGYIIKGINNLKQHMPDLRLDVLYYNISGLNIVEQTKETFAENFSGGYLKNISRGLFEAKTRTIYICTDIEEIEAVFMHELFGHGASVAYIDKGNIQIESSIKIYNRDGLDYAPEWIFTTLGYSFEEAKAEMISLLAQDKSLKEATTYELHVQELSILLSASGVSLAELSNNGLRVLVNSICDMNINCFALINNLDRFEDCVRMGALDIHENYLVSRNVKAFLSYYYKYLINSGYSSQEALSQIREICEKCDMGPILGGFLGADHINIYYETEGIISSLEKGEEISTVELEMDSIIKNKQKTN